MINLSNIEAVHKCIIVAPDVAKCPRCGTWSPRNEIRSKHYWQADLSEATVVEIRGGCYICPVCPSGKQWFKTEPEQYNTNRQYEVTTQDVIIDLVRRFKLSLEGAALFGREVLHLTMLTATTVMDWIRDAGDATDTRSYRIFAVEAFSGQLTVDEVYDGGYYQLKATDPLNDMELLWDVGEGSPCEDDVRRFFQQLKAMGVNPLLVATDGSPLYPKVIEEVWPGAKHQRCVFHFLMQVNKILGKVFWELYKTMPEPPKRKRGRPKKLGRPRRDKEKRENRRKVRKVRFLLFKRERNPDETKDRWTEQELAALEEGLSLCPPLRGLRRLVIQLHELFGKTTDSHELAKQRRQAILDDTEFAEIPGVSTCLEYLRDDDLFARLTRYLDFENAEKTSNHVERENREFRKRQKSHYRLRSLWSIFALLDMLTVRKPIPLEPRRLTRKEIVSSQEEEVLSNVA
jgi:hypothetical protein